MKKLLTVTFFALTLALSAYAKSPSLSTAVFNVTPRMSCQNCENRIKSNLRFEKGVKSIETSLKDQTVTVTFNTDKTNVEALRKGFAKIGYEAVPTLSEKTEGKDNEIKK